MEGKIMREIGRVLKEGRLALGLDIGDIAKKTCISQHYLKSMEEGRFDIIPAVFDKGYIKIYAIALGMDAKQILVLYEQKKARNAVQPIVRTEIA